MADFFNQLVSILTVLGQIVIIVMIICLFFSGRTQKIGGFFPRNAVLFSFIVALLATLGSLFYSDILGYEPCKLCWYQRILMYPQVFVLGLALWRKDKAVKSYSLLLAVIGGLIAGYHYLLQIGVASGVPCGAVGYSVSCSQRFVMEYGYITIPMMALTAFVMIILFSVLGFRQDKNIL